MPSSVAGAVLQPGDTAFLPVAEGEALDLGVSFRSGQIFRWRESEGVWYGPFGEAALALATEPGGVRVACAGAAVPLAEVWRFLALDAPLSVIQAAIATDDAMMAAVATFPGLRVLRQQPWECLAGYLCSQWNNIPKIEGSTEQLARRWGQVHTFPSGLTVATFPPPEALAGRSEADLRACALGYRCPYLIETARRIAAGEVDLVALRDASYEDALAALLDLPGVGRKVADCVLLFSLDKREALPVDVWVRRVVHEHYLELLGRILRDAGERREKGLSAVEYRAIVALGRERWGGLAGWAQQYLFCARREGVV